MPKLKKSLISCGQLDDVGYHTIFGNTIWKVSKGSMTVAKGSKIGTLYPLHLSCINASVINVIEQPSISLWHSQLGCISQKEMKVLSSLG